MAILEILKSVDRPKWRLVYSVNKTYTREIRRAPKIEGQVNGSDEECWEEDEWKVDNIERYKEIIREESEDKNEIGQYRTVQRMESENDNYIERYRRVQREESTHDIDIERYKGIQRAGSEDSDEFGLNKDRLRAESEHDSETERYRRVQRAESEEDDEFGPYKDRLRAESEHDDEIERYRSVQRARSEDDDRIDPYRLRAESEYEVNYPLYNEILREKSREDGNIELNREAQQEQNYDYKMIEKKTEIQQLKSGENDFIGLYKSEEEYKTDMSELKYMNELPKGYWISWKDECRNTNEDEAIKYDIVTIHPNSNSTLEAVLFEDLPNCRFMKYYCSIETCFASPTTAIVNEAEKLLEQLATTRSSIRQAKRPIIFIGYSICGIILKQLMFLAWKDEKYRDLWNAKIGVIFLGTPYHGTETTTIGHIIDCVSKPWGPHLGGSRSRSRRRRSSSLDSSYANIPVYDLAYALDANSGSFMRLTSIFRVLMKCQIYSFYEKNYVYSHSILVSNGEPEVPRIDDKSFPYSVVEEDYSLMGSRNERQIPMDTDIKDLLSARSSAEDSYKKLFDSICDIITPRTASDVQAQSIQSVNIIQAPHMNNHLSLVSFSPLQSHCPVCSNLLVTEATGTAVSIPEYSMDYDHLKGKQITLWYEKCGLAQIVYYLARRWSRKAADVEWISNFPKAYSFTFRWPGMCYVPQRGPSSEKWTSRVNVENGKHGPGMYSHFVSQMITIAVSGGYLCSLFDHVVVFSDPISPATVKRLHQWLGACQDLHEECENRISYLPTRVLDVHDLEMVKLRDSSGQKAQYIALSHCWGACKAFMTTRKTIGQMKSGFSLAEAPKTFQDAIVVTRLLGIRYLWIDCLCIIQEDIVDWTSEGSKMAEVYGNAYLTITAANSDDDSKGFLALRPFDYYPLKFTSPVNQSEIIYLSNAPQAWSPVESDTEPVDTRGWTLQEQYLSPRNLVFGTNQITWRCKHTVLSEGLTESGQRKASRRVTTLKNSSWEDLVTAFCQRSLTYDEDTLPAMAGIASQMAKSKGSRYCAGLWWEDMPACLLFWQNAESPPSEYRAPSWSWAARNGSVGYWYSNNSQPMTVRRLDQVTFLDYFCQTPRGSPYMQLEAPAWLKVEAPIALIQHADDCDRRRRREGECIFHFPKSYRFNPMGVGDGWGDRGTTPYPNICCFFDRPVSTEGIYALMLAQVSRDNPERSAEWEEERRWSFEHISGILVRQATLFGSRDDGKPIESSNHLLPVQISEDISLDRYERVGFFEIKRLFPDVEGTEILKDYPAKKILLY